MRLIPTRLREFLVAIGEALPAGFALVYLWIIGLRLFPAEGVAPMDFQCFWAASKFALTGTPSDVYDMDVFKAAQHALLGSTDAPACMFIYPPLSLLLFLPLALLPYTASALVWLTATAAAYAAGLRALLPGWAPVPLFFAFPAAFLNAWYVQSGFLSAALFAGAASQLSRRPILAGVCVGCLVFKPHLGLVLPLALAAAGRWRAFFAATTVVLASAAVATAGFGADIWPAFLTSVEHASRWMEDPPGRVGFDMASVFAAVRFATGGHVGWAYAVQACAAGVACGLMVAALYRRPGGQAEGALMAAAASLSTPYFFQYNQIILAVPLAWVLAEARRTGFLPWERIAFGALLLSPALTYAAVLAWGIPLAPLTSIGVFAATLRRVRCLSPDAAGAPAPPRVALA